MIDDSVKQTLAVAAAWEGKPLNYSSIGKQLGITCPAAKARVQRLAGAGLVWLLDPLAAKPAGKSRKSPKLYVERPARPLLPLAGLSGQEEDLFLGGMIRTVRTLETARYKNSKFWYYGGYGKNHVELIVQTALKRIGFVFLEENRFTRWSWSYCRRVLRRGIIQGAFVLYPGHRIFFAADRMVILPDAEFCEHYRRWMNACLGSSRKLLKDMVRTYNTANAQLLS
jgi:hypothetical protein